MLDPDLSPDEQVEDNDVPPVVEPREAKDIRSQQDKFLKWIESPNIAADLEDSERDRIGMLVKREFEIDWNSCSEWREQYRKHLEFAMQITEEKTYPWPKASNVLFPLLTTAALQFNARAYPAIVNGPHIVKGIVIGKDDGQPLLQNGKPAIGPDGQPVWMVPPGEKRKRADNVADHMSWQLLSEQEEWEGDTDRLLVIVPVTGFCARKTYFDPVLGRNRSDIVTGDKLVINYHAKSWATAPRMTEEIMLYPSEIEDQIRAGTFVDQEYPSSTSPDNAVDGDVDAPIEFLEQHRRIDLDDDGYPEPYIVTVHKETGKVARIVARYDASGILFNKQTHDVTKITAIQFYTPYYFMPDPGGGIYGMGFGQLLHSVGSAINTTLNQMLDAGHLQIRGGGFIGKSLSMNTGNVRFTMGEYKAVNVAGTSVRESIVPLQFPGPNEVLFQLLGLLIEAGKEISATKDVLSGDIGNANVPATTTLALIEQGLKVFTAIYKRIYRALGSELKKLYRLNSIYLAEETSYENGEEWRSIRRADYNKHSGVQPISDPSRVVDMQRLGRAGFLLQFKDDPFFNGREIRNRVLEEAQVDNKDQLLLANAAPNPAVMAKISEVASRAARDRAAEVRDIATAINQLAQARKVSDDVHLGWFDQQLQLYAQMLEQPAVPPPGGPGAPPPGAPPQGGPGAPPQQPMPQGGPAPPVPGARLAPDGRHYVPDPRRPGRYLMVV